MMKGSFLAVALLSGSALSFSVPARTSIRAGRGVPFTSTTAAWGTATTTTTADEVDEVEAMGIHVPFGLRKTLITNSHDAISKRFWIVDNSGSMSLHDGHLASVDHGDHHNAAESFTRWDEVSETVNCHAQLASALSAPTEFRLLNPPKYAGPLIRGPQRFCVGYGLNTPKQAAKDCKRAQSIMLRNDPSGRTPIAASIRDVRRDIIKMLPQLEADGSKVCIVIATDGCNCNAQNAGLEVDEEERNQELVHALESLRGLPVCVVVRLCTDYEPVVSFYNGLDESLDIDIDVLDDHVAEAEEVYEYNSWLNYALVVHRMREMGQDCRLFDLLDERPFTREEVREFCVLLLGNDDLHHVSDWANFLEEVDRLQQQERKHWNPKTKTSTPWINTRRLASMGQYADE